MFHYIGQQSAIWNLQTLTIIWKQGYAPPSSDRRDGVLARKRLEYVDCVSQYYDIPDSERSDDEINMLRQVFFPRIDFLLVNTNLTAECLYIIILHYSLLADLCGLPKNCPRCHFLPACSNSEIFGTHSLYLVRFHGSIF